MIDDASLASENEFSPAMPDDVNLRALYADLTEKTALLQTTLGSISQGILMIGVDGRVNTYNKKVCELLNLPESALMLRPTLQELTLFQLNRGDFGPDACLVEPGARHYVRAVSNGEVPGDYLKAMKTGPASYLRTTRAGRVLEVKTQNLPSGGMVRTFADVTDYVQAEQARARLHMLLEATQSMARVGGWEVDTVNDRVFWTDEVYRMLDTSPQEYTPTTATTGHFFAPESVPKVNAAIMDLMDQGKPHDLELEMITATGRRIWVHTKAMVTHEQGQVVKRTSVLQDITERKLADAELRETEARWKLALDSTGDGVWDWNIASGVEIFSTRFLEMYGFE